jgi:1-aminocyclopropane-1-carboxylate deaminase
VNTAFSPIDLSKITIDRLPAHLTGVDIEVSVLRLDKIHALISGNKFFKLRFYLEEAKALKKKKIITYGGAWSNHILATAAICKMENFESIGLIRGEEAGEISSTLKQAKELGMQLVFLDRETYRLKIVPPLFNEDDCFIVPEGGFGEKGMRGASTICNYFNKEAYSHILCAVGTGTMLAGLISSTSGKINTTGISVLKNNYSLEEAVTSLVGNNRNNWQLLHDYSFGGYAKYPPLLTDFMIDFFKATGIPTDIVYTGKLFYAVLDLVKKNVFINGSKILVIHSGGLQGNNSLKTGTLNF